eukprot:gene23442-biopygen8865
MALFRDEWRGDVKTDRCVVQACRRSSPSPALVGEAAGRVPDASHTIEIEDPDASHTIEFEETDANGRVPDSSSAVSPYCWAGRRRPCPVRVRSALVSFKLCRVCVVCASRPTSVVVFPWEAHRISRTWRPGAGATIVCQPGRPGWPSQAGPARPAGPAGLGCPPPPRYLQRSGPVVGPARGRRPGRDRRPGTHDTHRILGAPAPGLPCPQQSLRGEGRGTAPQHLAPRVHPLRCADRARRWYGWERRLVYSVSTTVSGSPFESRRVSGVLFWQFATLLCDPARLARSLPPDGSRD